jgi:protease-4
MRKKWFSLGCLTSLILFGLFIWLGIHSANKYLNDKSVSVSPSSYLYLNLKGSIPEYFPLKDSNFGNWNISAKDIIDKIKYAKVDVKIKGIILEPKFISVGLATSHEIMEALEDFKKSGKKVIAYFDMGGNRDYFLASVANEIVLNPSSSSFILLTGLGHKTTYYKDILDKIGVDMKVVHAGKYKGYGENYSRNSMSPEVKENISRLFDGVYSEMLSTIAGNRKISLGEMQKIYNSRKNIFISGQYALDLKLVDKLMYREDLYKQLKIDKKHLISISNYGIKYNIPIGAKIGVLYANGPITTADKITENRITSKKLNQQLDKLMKDSSIKSIVIRVNSPGGSAMESDIIWKKIKEVKKVKPVVISMGDVAASGGYFISSGADYIIADPFTITGSIGVVAVFPNISKLSKKIGFNRDGVVKGKFSNILDPMEPINPETLNAFKMSINRTYDEFKMRVSNGRNISLSNVELIAQGQVWNSQDALNNKLIDDLGDLNKAIRKAASIAGIKDYSVVYFPKQKDIFEVILEDKFNISNVGVFYKNHLLKDFQLDKAYEFYQMMKGEPIQEILPFYLD